MARGVRIDDGENPFYVNFPVPDIGVPEKTIRELDAALKQLHGIPPHQIAASWGPGTAATFVNPAPEFSTTEFQRKMLEYLEHETQMTKKKIGDLERRTGMRAPVSGVSRPAPGLLPEKKTAPPLSPAFPFTAPELPGVTFTSHERIGDAVRDLYLDHLGQMLAEGRLDQAEYDARLALMMKAKTKPELECLIQDLPQVPVPGKKQYMSLSGKLLALPAGMLFLAGSLRTGGSVSAMLMAFSFVFFGLFMIQMTGGKRITKR